ncbi:hypothetical protein [Streptomyces griseoaurantiacus]|uniref:Uncharacterized protein n=1 Tax=Streptomyces griseoaurantiacus TaxID=68213 RepID=A0A1G7VLP8_9ACTN|nr:hypothetical protein [Streptomyces jietaisiensis]SDG60521.1 hypothetical protein SAMN05216260_12397 [Streptomyces jietaisiensis]
MRRTRLDGLDRPLGDVHEDVTVLDRLGKPPVDEGLGSDAGRARPAGLRRLARHERLVVKLSGLSAEARDAATLRGTARTCRGPPSTCPARSAVCRAATGR